MWPNFTWEPGDTAVVKDGGAMYPYYPLDKFKGHTHFLSRRRGSYFNGMKGTVVAVQKHFSRTDIDVALMTMSNGESIVIGCHVLEPCHYQKSAFVVGDRVKITDPGYRYPDFDTWEGLQGRTLAPSSINTHGLIGTVVVVGPHTCTNRLAIDLILIETARGYVLMNQSGVEKYSGQMKTVKKKEADVPADMRRIATSAEFIGIAIEHMGEDFALWQASPTREPSAVVFPPTFFVDRLGRLNSKTQTGADVPLSAWNIDDGCKNKSAPSNWYLFKTHTDALAFYDKFNKKVCSCCGQEIKK